MRSKGRHPELLLGVCSGRARVAGQVVSAWILTWPSCMVFGFLLEKAFTTYEPVLVLALVGVVVALIAYLLFAKRRREIRET